MEASGEIAELKTTVNGMVMSLRTLADEVSRVSLEVGSQGKLGGQANVPDVEGVWKEMTVNVSALLRAKQALGCSREIYKHCRKGDFAACGRQ